MDAMKIFKKTALATVFAVILAAFSVTAVAKTPAGGTLKSGSFFRDCSVCPELAVIPAGSYMMGSNNGRRREKPVHKVTIARPFAFGRYEVTFDQWKACRVAGGCAKKPDDHKWGRGIRPVVNITFADVKQYLAWISGKTGHTYRLPTEAEWEYAARAGTTTDFWWGDKIGNKLANCRNCAPKISRGTYPVGTFKANAFGLYDVHGNVWEWVEDCWNPSYSGAPADGSARLDGNCRFRVTRSGSWYYFSPNLRSASRSKFPAKGFSYGIGFRVVRELD